MSSFFSEKKNEVTSTYNSLKFFDNLNFLFVILLVFWTSKEHITYVTLVFIQSSGALVLSMSIFFFNSNISLYLHLSLSFPFYFIISYFPLHTCSSPSFSSMHNSFSSSIYTSFLSLQISRFSLTTLSFHSLHNFSSLHTSLSPGLRLWLLSI